MCVFGQCTQAATPPFPPPPCTHTHTEGKFENFDCMFRYKMALQKRTRTDDEACQSWRGGGRRTQDCPVVRQKGGPSPLQEGLGVLGPKLQCVLDAGRFCALAAPGANVHFRSSKRKLGFQNDIWNIYDLPAQTLYHLHTPYQTRVRSPVPRNHPAHRCCSW